MGESIAQTLPTLYCPLKVTPSNSAPSPPGSNSFREIARREAGRQAECRAGRWKVRDARREAYRK